jgi:hypothetical protein
MGPVPNKPKAAFPLHTEFSTKFGMDLRDWFAGMALQGAVVDGYYDCPELAADYAYKIADAMMEQRKSPAETGKE